MPPSENMSAGIFCGNFLVVGFSSGFSRGIASERTSADKLQETIMDYIASSSSDDDSSTGYDIGYSDGYFDGESANLSAYDDGYDEGYGIGLNDGYIDGYAEGIYDSAHLLFGDADSPAFSRWWYEHTGLSPVPESLHTIEAQVAFVLFLDAQPFSHDLIGEVNPFDDTVMTTSDHYYNYLWQYVEDVYSVSSPERWYH